MNEDVWRAVLDREKAAQEGVEIEDEESEEEDEDEEELEEEDGWGDREFVSDMSGDEDGLSDLEDALVSYSFCNVSRAVPNCASQSSEDDEEDGSGEEDSDDEPKGKTALGKRKAAPLKPPKKKPEKKARRMYLLDLCYSGWLITNDIRWTKGGSGIRARDGDRTPHKRGCRKLVMCMIIHSSCLCSTSRIVVDDITVLQIPQASRGSA